MTEEQLATLRLAAKAAGYEVSVTQPDNSGLWLDGEDAPVWWNPYIDGNDALLLASALRISISFRTNQNGEFVVTECPGILFCAEQITEEDCYPEMCKSIVDAAAMAGASA